MYQGKLRKITFVIMALYTLLIFYFIYIGFNRASFLQDSGMRYNLIPGGIQLHLPVGREFKINFFELGNFAAFIPFGIAIPLLFRCGFLRFISVFVLCIAALEALQMVSRLGAFDINDIIINTLGAAVGYWAQCSVKHHRDTWKGISRIILTAIVFTGITIAVIGGINHYSDNVLGESVALNDLALKDGSVLWDESLSGFTAGLTEVDPQINLYSTKNTSDNNFSYSLDGNYAKMEGYVAIPGDVAGTAGSEVIFIADGEEVYSIGLAGGHPPDSFQVPLKGVNELIIKVINNDQNSLENTVLWDIVLAKVNTGQQLLNSIGEWMGRLF